MEQKKRLGPGKRFQTRITLYLMMFSCIPILVLWIVLQTITSQMLKNQMINRKQTELTSFSRQLDELVEQQNQNLEQFVQDEDVMTFLQGQSESVYRVNYKLQLVFGAEKDRLAVYVLPRGKQSATGTQEVPDYYKFPYNELDWGIFRKTNQDKYPVLHLNERRGSIASETAFSIAQAVRVDGSLIGYVIIDVTDLALEGFLSENIAEMGNGVYLYDDWEFVCYSSGGQAYTGRNGLPDYLSSYSEDQTETKLPDGTPVGFILQKNSGTGLNILGEIPFYRVSQTMDVLNQAAFGLLAVCILLSIIAAILTANEIVSPLNIILEHIRSVQHGDFTDHIGSDRKDEFGTVMKAFDKMTKRLSHYIYIVEEKQKNLRTAEMKNLQAQIRPHFLYNTLDLIKWNIRLNEGERAVTMLTNLGKLLRSTIDTNDYVMVEEELDLVRRYLEIQTVHYNGQLDVGWEIEEGIEKLVIPKLILQPIVENSVIHGLAPGRKDNQIRITGQRQEKYLIFHVKDNGKGISHDKVNTIHDSDSQTGSIGISNVHSRLKLFGDDTCGVFYQKCDIGANVMLICRILETE